MRVQKSSIVMTGVGLFKFTPYSPKTLMFLR